MCGFFTASGGLGPFRETLMRFSLNLLHNERLFVLSFSYQVAKTSHPKAPSVRKNRTPLR